ncbi:hypothetical protein [Rhodobacter ferrooxidans]|uniref:Uncharacterized protein n=1 Tax=Rhodobacter ferrooxidans TaxID=371731 RepID=C8S1L4_9RHOB|nr:hypothetical protein [Rhodobacter sp. SW2]EEW25187.1 conserved hypothetical protein [Rhodobacter sp. SW2]
MAGALFRPEVLALLRRWREVIAAALVAAGGLWLMRLGGWLLIPLGAALVGLALGLGLLAWRRMRFWQGVDAPGVVEVDEAQISYFGPEAGGFVALPDLVELRLVRLQGRQFWRLKQADGQALLIPVAAAGAALLFDAFAELPGMDSQALVAALAPGAAGAVSGARGLAMVSDTASIGPVIWRRAARAALTRAP